MIKVGIIGSGSMGTGIAQVASTAGHEVVLYDNDKNALQKSINNLTKILDRLVEKAKITNEKKFEILNNIKPVNTIEELKGSGLVIEAIIEDLKIKKDLFNQVEKLCKQDCIIASNTSSLSISALASSCDLSERFIGIHFFNPAPLMPLVEITPAIQTSKKTENGARELINSWNKITVLAKDTPGFIVNRIARPFYGEALRIYEEGIADFATIDWAMKEIGGFRMGPFTLMDFIGNDINYAVTESVFKAFYFDPRYKPSFTQKSYAEAGWLGRKTARGYYDYSQKDIKQEANKNLELANQIVNRILLMLINEAADALFLNIASRDDIDMAMTKGVNYPKGLLFWADEIGIQKCVEGLDELYFEYKEDRYRCSPILRRMLKRGEKFY